MNDETNIPAVDNDMTPIVETEEEKAKRLAAEEAAMSNGQGETPAVEAE